MANPSTCPNTLLYSSSNKLSQASSTRLERHYLVYFLPGNPGLVEFYRSYLEALHRKLSEHIVASDQNVRIDILGITLAGFECGPIEAQDRRRRLYDVPVGIDGQLDFIEKHLEDHAGPHTQVILMGHSLGAYLMMELLRRRRSMLELTHTNIIGAIGLFPAVVHLAQSKSGQRLERLFHIPCLPFLVLLFVRFLGLLPAYILLHVVNQLLHYPEHSAKTTVMWLKSRRGFQQSMDLLREEFERITEDTWEDDLWNSGVHLLFGNEDDYVPSVHRDALILARSRRNPESASGPSRAEDQLLGPCLELAAPGIPHDFSVMHSEPVAEKAKEWVVKLLHRSEPQ